MRTPSNFTFVFICINLCSFKGRKIWIRCSRSWFPLPRPCTLVYFGIRDTHIPPFERTRVYADKDEGKRTRNFHLSRGLKCKEKLKLLVIFNRPVLRCIKSTGKTERIEPRNKDLEEPTMADVLANDCGKVCTGAADKVRLLWTNGCWGKSHSWLVEYQWVKMEELWYSNK